MSVLHDILSVKREEVTRGKRARSASALDAEASSAPAVRPFADALRSASGCAVIAEIKKASPSKGIIREDFEPARIARSYQAGGAACLSVLTDQEFFLGHADHLREARGAASLPVLRKDFNVDPWQVTEARSLGADCILIILSAVDDICAAELADAATKWGMDALFEAHDEREVDRANLLSARLIGINNRDLRTFHTDLANFERLAPRAEDALLVAESGISTNADVQRLERAGASACLVGESLMRAGDPGLALQSLLAPVPSSTESAACLG